VAVNPQLAVGPGSVASPGESIVAAGPALV